jgi:hypothetical protein
VLHASGIDEPLAVAQPPEPPIPVLAEPAATAPADAPSFSRWQLLNPYTVRHSGLFSLGLVRFRPTPDTREVPGYYCAWGESVSTARGYFATGGLQEHELRFVPHDALSLGLWRYQWEAGLRLGPFEPRARVGFTLMHLDVGHGFSFGMFSPRVGLGLWLKLGPSRLGLSAFTEYFWRWVGSENAFVHGLSLELQVDGGPLLKPSISSPAAPARQ